MGIYLLNALLVLMYMYNQVWPSSHTLAPSVGTGGRVEWMLGPGACPRTNTIRWHHKTRTNRVASRTGTRPPPLSASAPCPYRAGEAFPVILYFSLTAFVFKGKLQ